MTVVCSLIIGRVELADLQIELINVSSDELAVESLGTQIINLREERQEVLTAVAERKDLQLRMQEMIEFLNEQQTAITEYSARGLQEGCREYYNFG